MEDKQERKNRIDDYFNIWNERVTKPTDVQKKVAPYIENLPEDFDSALSDYIAEIQEQAFRAGFSMAMQLAADCYTESKQFVPRQ